MAMKTFLFRLSSVAIVAASLFYATTAVALPLALSGRGNGTETGAAGSCNNPSTNSCNGTNCNCYGFTGTGAMQISVLWSGTTYLTMTVSCPSGSQSVGGTSAMEASLGDASGNCRATVSEPSSESVALTYTISIGPAGG